MKQLILTLLFLEYSSLSGKSICVLDLPYDFGGAAPGWALGQQGFNFLADGRLVATYSKDGNSVLLVATVSGEGSAADIQESGMEEGLPIQFGSVVPGKTANEIYFIGGSPSTPTSIYHWNLAEKQPAKLLFYPVGLFSFFGPYFRGKR